MISATLVSLGVSFRYLVIDEADLICALGYEEDTKSLVQHFPKIFQVRFRYCLFSHVLK